MTRRRPRQGRPDRERASGRPPRPERGPAADARKRRPAPDSHGRRHAPDPHGRRPAPDPHGRKHGPDPHGRRPQPPVAGGLPPRRPEQDRELSQLMAANAPPSPGDWLWTTREGAERDCVEELLLRRSETPGLSARAYLPSLVVSTRAVRDSAGRLDLTFARQGFGVEALVHELDETKLAEALASAAALLVRGNAYAVHVFVPDSATGNRLAQRAERIGTLLETRLAGALPGAEQVDPAALRRTTAELVQVCLCSPDTAALGVLPSDQALSIWPGGRARMRVAAERPSRAARKLEEALVWLGTGPGPGELCVDLGAAPGGWSWLLLNRRARVIAIDPARLEPQLLTQRRLTHVQASAFDWQPDEPVDWLLCDMAWRPLEVAQMLGRWARRKQTRMLVANFKLPMKRKAEMVAHLRSILANSGYQQLRTRQLYHDREEITVTARV